MTQTQEQEPSQEEAVATAKLLAEMALKFFNMGFVKKGYLTKIVSAFALVSGVTSMGSGVWNGIDAGTLSTPTMSELLGAGLAAMGGIGAGLARKDEASQARLAKIESLLQIVAAGQNGSSIKMESQK